MSMPLINSDLGTGGLSFLNENHLSMCISGWMWYMYALVRKGDLEEMKR